MKKTLLALVAFCATVNINAQTIKLLKNGNVVATYTSEQVDQVLFEKTPIIPTTGTAKRKGDTEGSTVEVRWVQLWKDGPKFAEYNVGATSETEYGGYYTWGGNKDKDRTYHGKPGTDLTGAGDTATNLWGDNWRMPTCIELIHLKTNCIYTWTSKNGVNGLLFTGKEGTDYASNSIFLPATGIFADELGVFDEGGSGYYWTSTSYQQYTEYLEFAIGVEDNIFCQLASYGSPSSLYSVRAVLNEKK